MTRKFRNNPEDKEVQDHDMFISWVKVELDKIGLKGDPDKSIILNGRLGSMFRLVDIIGMMVSYMNVTSSIPRKTIGSLVIKPLYGMRWWMVAPGPRMILYYITIRMILGLRA